MDYKKYSLENLENWLYDAMSAGEATPQEIYDTIKKVVEENYYIYKEQTAKAYELLALLNGNGKGHIEAYDAVMREKEYYEPSMPPWGHSDLEYMIHNKHNKESLSCDKDDSSPECKGAWNSFWDDVDEDVKESILNEGYDWTPLTTQDKVVKWQLPVEMDGLTGECYVQFPDDLLERAGLVEGDVVEWVPQDNDSYLLRKVNA